MPVVQRQILPRRPRQPSKLSQWIQGIGTAAQAAGNVANIVTLPRRLRLEDQRAEIAERQIELQENLRADSLQEMSDKLFFSSTLGMQAFGRARTLGGLGEEPDPESLMGATTVGDIADDAWREEARRRRARMLGVDVEMIGDDHILSQQTLGDVLDQTTAQMTLSKLIDMWQTGEVDPLLSHSVGQQFGLPEGMMPGEAMIQEAQANTVIRELIHVEQTEGGGQRVVGSLISEPSTGLRTAAEAMGLTLHREHDIDGRRVVVPQTMLDDIYKLTLQEPFQAREDFRESRLRMVENISSEFGLPNRVASNIIDGNLEEIPQEWRGVAATLLRSRWAGQTSVLATQPNGILVREAIEEGVAMDLEGDDLVEYIGERVRQGGEQLGIDVGEIGREPWYVRVKNWFKDTPNSVIQQAPDVRQGFMGLMGSDPFEGITGQTATGEPIFIGQFEFTLNEGQGTLQAPMNLSYEDFMRNFSTVVPDIAGALANESPEQAEEYILQLQTTPGVFSDRTVPILTPPQAILLREQVRAIRSGEITIPPDSSGGGR